jgi:hypothetical protein
LLALVASGEGRGAEPIRLKRYPEVAECVDRGLEAPCTHRECRYHLAHRGYWEHEVAPNRDCSLDVANEGPHTLDQVADALGVSAERVRQLEQQAFESLRLEPTLRQFYDEDELPRARPARAKRGQR